VDGRSFRPFVPTHNADDRSSHARVDLSHGPKCGIDLPYMVGLRNESPPRHPRMPTYEATSAALSRACTREVAIAIEASASFSRGVLEGISRWMGEHEGWMITIDDREPGVPIPGWFLRWAGHGLISGLEESSLPRAWRAGQRPVVHVRSRLPVTPLPGIYPDDEAAVRLCVAHLAERGVGHLVFLPGTSPAMQGLCDAVVHQAVAFGCRLDIHEPPQRNNGGRKRDDDEDRDAVARWLATLPKPVGVIATSDVHALRIIEGCRRCGIAVPDDVAVVGIGDDEVLCGLATPGLTSVTHDRSRIGQEAARMLDEAMRFGRPPSTVIYVPPAGIAIRRSSDVFAVDDADIRKALRVIQTRACADVSAAEVAVEVRVPRRVLDRKFQRLLGRTIHDELQRMKVAEAKRLLLETEDKLLVISMRSGFTHAPQLCNVFKSVVGMSPMQYRKAARSCRETALPKMGRTAGQLS
jgi:LacI family transcriptional regulator